MSIARVACGQQTQPRSLNKMAKVSPAMEMTEADLRLMLAANVHIGTENVSTHMKQYVFKKADNGRLHRRRGRLTCQDCISSTFRRLGRSSCLLPVPS